MITRADFATIDMEIKDSIEKVLDDLRKSIPEDYILFLADGEYKKEYDNAATKFSPYVIDNRMDKIKDESRLRFLSEFLTTFYAFPTSQVSTDDNEQRMHMELMIYTHIWESKPFLKKLYRLAHLNNGEEYEWGVNLPEMGKHDFIRNDIRQTFQDKGSPIADIIRKGFHTSLRNAFAHSEYIFDNMNNNRRIILTNYNGEAWELQDISYNDWSKRFVYSALLSYYLLKITHDHRTKLIETFGKDVFQIKHPDRKKHLHKRPIKYRKEVDGFNFEK